MKTKLNMSLLALIVSAFAGNVYAMDCSVDGTSLKDAQNNFKKYCAGEKRVDCDPINQRKWVCANYRVNKNNLNSITNPYTDKKSKPSNTSKSSNKNSGSNDSTGPKKYLAKNVDRTLSKSDQTPGGKRIFKVPNRPSNYKAHRTGVSRYTDLGNNLELYQVNADLGFRSGVSKTSRAEGYFSYSDRNGTRGKTFSATYQIFDSENITIFQQKGNNTPSVRISVSNDTRLVINLGNGKPVQLGTIQKNSIFSIEVQDKGTRSDITLRDESGKVLGKKTVKNDRHGAFNNKQFRYGVYTQKGEKNNVTVIVSNARVR